MAALNFAELAAPLSPDAPCGPDLDGDPDFANVVASLEVALPTSYFRRDDEGQQIPFDRASIDFPAAFADLGKLLARTRDIRLFVLSAKLSLLNRDIASFASSLDLIAANMAEHWDAFHPVPEEGDAILREVALQTLDDMATVVLPLQHAPLVTSRRIGPLAIRSQLVAAGDVRLVEGEQHPDAGAIQAALGDVDLAELTGALDRVRLIADALGRMSALWSEKQGERLTFPRLSALTNQIVGFLDAAVARRIPGHKAAGADESTDEVREARLVAEAGTCTSILQVKDALSACLGYFRSAEPSSPAVLLIGQAQQLIGKSLIEVIQIMFPEHVDKAMIDFGQTLRFQLPLERLASFQPDGAESEAAQEEAPQDDAAQEDDAYGEDAQDGDAQDEEAQDEEAREDGGGQATPSGTAPASATVPVRTRAEAVQRMAAVARFYRMAEPSHPTPLLMDKACALAQHDFMSLLGDILPDIAARPEAGS
jgi:type VI secretion system protein ImpA